MDYNLGDKIVIITGGTSGIGLETALLFCEHGAKVAVCSRSEARVRAAQNRAKEAGYQLFAKQVDVGDEQALRQFIDEVAAYYGGIDILVNNAGLNVPGFLMEQTKENWDKVMNANLAAVWIACQAAVPYLEKRGGGAIVSTSSFASFTPTASSAAYAVSKAGVNMITKILASELAAKKIRVNAVAPGVINTEIIENLLSRYGEEKLTDLTVMRRLGEAKEIANCILFLAGEGASYITGQVLEASGGKLIVQDLDNSWPKK